MLIVSKAIKRQRADVYSELLQINVNTFFYFVLIPILQSIINVGSYFIIYCIFSIA